MTSRPRLSVTIFSDYVCPFCYVGSRRVLRLREHFDLDITWSSLEIHPQTPPEGMPLTELGYPAELWERMMAHLDSMARDEGLDMAERTFTTNSHNALLLAEAARHHSPEAFMAVHEGLFAAFFTGAMNIGDPEVLRQIALESGMDDSDFEQALMDPRFEEALNTHFVSARQYGITGVPAFLLGEQVVSGAVPFDELLAVAQQAASAG